MEYIASERIDRYVFSEYPDSDTCWSICVGPDEKVYVGVCFEHNGGGVAQLYSYDPDTQSCSHVLDMGEVTGEPGDSGKPTQGKIHFALCPSSDGMIYGATHCSTPPANEKFWNAFSAWDDPDRRFSGGHIWRYNTSTGAVVDFGIIVPQEGIPLLLLDEKNGYLYGVTYPRAHFFRCNLLGRDYVDYGRISEMYPLSISLGADGNVYTSDFSGKLIRFNTKTEKIEFLPFQAPHRPESDGRMNWLNDQVTGPDNRIYSGSYNHSHIFCFDPYKVDKDGFIDLGPGLDEEGDYTCRGFVFDKKGRLYYGVALTGKETLVARMDIATGKKEVFGMLKTDMTGYFWRATMDKYGKMYMAETAISPTQLIIFTPPE